MDLLSRLDLFDVGRRYILSRAAKVDPDMVDTEGSDANLYVGSMSFVGHALSRQLSERLAALFLDGAEDDDLDRYAFDRYQELRKGAAPARGAVRFFRTTLAAGAGNVAIGTKVISLSGVEYITTTTAIFGASTLEAAANVRAVQAGKTFQVGKNQIRRFANSGALFDTTLQVNNDLATAGGEDVEVNNTFRERVRDFWGTARRGTIGAIEFGAKTVSGIDSAQAVEALSSTAQPARVVNLYVADSSGVASAALSKEVDTALLDYRAAGIAVILSTSIPQIVDVVLQLAFNAGVDTSTLTENIRAAIFEFVNSLPVNGTLLRGALFSVLQRFASDGLVADESTIVSPTGDLIPAPGTTLRTQLGNITVV